MDIFKLSRNFFDWSFENPELISPNHSAIYFFAIEHCNRLWWKEKFWFPTSMVMEAIWIRKWETYNKAYQDLIKWWFVKEIEKSKNQYSSCIISITSATPKNGKALDKALVKHSRKHSRKHSESTSESKGVIDIQETRIQETIVYKENANKDSTDVYPYFLYVFLELGWKPWKSDTIENLQEWMRWVLKDWWIKSASDAIQTLKEFYKYWECRKDEKWFDKKNWKMTLINSPSLPSNKSKYATSKK